MCYTVILARRTDFATTASIKLLQTHCPYHLLAGGNPANLSGYVNEEYDSLMERAGTQLNLDRRRLYLEEAERVLLSDHPVMPLYFYVSKHLVRPEVQGWEDNVLDYHYSQHLSLDAGP